jgi:hypothetical protein
MWKPRTTPGVAGTARREVRPWWCGFGMSEEANALAEASVLGMVKSLMYISKNGEMVRLQSDSLKDY